MTGGFIQSILEDRFEIKTIIPDEKYLYQAHFFVSKELTQGVFTEEAMRFFLGQMHLMKDKGAEWIILGCTELTTLFKNTNFEIPLLATTDLHVNMAADFILS